MSRADIESSDTIGKRRVGVAMMLEAVRSVSRRTAQVLRPVTMYTAMYFIWGYDIIALT